MILAADILFPLMLKDDKNVYNFKTIDGRLKLNLTPLGTEDGLSTDDVAFCLQILPSGTNM